MLYNLALEPSLRKLKVNPALRSSCYLVPVKLPGTLHKLMMSTCLLQAVPRWMRWAKKSECMKLWLGPRLTVKTPSVCGLTSGRIVLFPSPSFGETLHTRCSASGSVPISNWWKIGQKYWKRFSHDWVVVTLEAFSKEPSWSVRLAHLSPGRSPIFSASKSREPSYSIWKIFYSSGRNELLCYDGRSFTFNRPKSV